MLGKTISQTGAATRRVVSTPSALTPRLAASLHVSASRLASKKDKPLPLLHSSQLSPSAPPPRKEPYSATTVSIVKGLARLMGYNSTTSTAIRVTSDLYDRCAERAHVERHFWYGECALPETYQSWFQITNLHVYLLMSRFRAFDRSEAQTYNQELINHFFLDAESRMRDRFGVQTSRLVKGYMRDMHQQHRGAILGYDEGLIGGDARLAQAVWRNIWGAGWGTVAGVKRKLAGIDKTVEGEKDTGDMPELARDLGIKTKPQSSASASHANAPTPLDTLAASNPELAYPQHLYRIVHFIRKESHRLANISDKDVMLGTTESRAPAPSRSEEAAKASPSIANFSRL